MRTVEEQREFDREKARRWRKNNPAASRAAVKRWAEKHPEKRKALTDKNNALRARDHLLKRYGLTKETFDEMLRAQSGACAACHLPMDEPCVDHDHRTGVVRGLLHRKCNVAMGLMGDDPERLRQLVEYLEHHRA